MRISETRDNAWRFQFGTLEVSTEKVKDSLLRIIKLTDHLSIIITNPYATISETKCLALPLPSLLVGLGWTSPAARQVKGKGS